MEPLTSSFRDPSGYIFTYAGSIYRQVNNRFSKAYDKFIASGLYDRLVNRGLLVPHQEIVDGSVPGTPDCYKILKPQRIPFISYPYEWSFSQLKEAAMLTLRIQHEALKRGFVLKDASAFNVQFLDSKPIFIDTLSFDIYVPGYPWVAYKQFCQHFLAPLALIAFTDITLSKLLISHIDGVTLPLASKLLPLRTRLNYSLATHIHLHSRMQQQYADVTEKESAIKAKNSTLSERGLRALIESLASTVKKLNWKMPKTEWGNYYAFSRIAAKHCDLVVSQDIDPVAVELNYRQNTANGPANILPLIQDFSSPTPAIGWGNTERSSFLERSHCDALLALALVHHLAISNNVPLPSIAKLFASITKWLVIEFVPKSDSQVARLLATRQDIFTEYDQRGFEAAFARHFTIEKTIQVPDSHRILYRMRTR